ncbi:hypothetical protein DRJ58_04725 [Candidatus Acetothermia bacterium]|nr:MAG: hypothetical protein DRJ58_04725 [Candidatus Acetothermia bacterium]
MDLVGVYDIVLRDLRFRLAAVVAVVFVTALLVAPTLAKERDLTNTERGNIQRAIDFLRQNGMDPRVPVTIQDIQDRLNQGKIKIDVITEPAGAEAFTKINGVIVLNENGPTIGPALRDSPSMLNIAALAAVLVHETIHSKFHSMPKGYAAQLVMGLFRLVSKIRRAIGTGDIMECTAYYAQFRTQRRWIENKLETGRGRLPDFNDRIIDFQEYVPKLPEESSKLTSEQKRQIERKVRALRKLKNQIMEIAHDTAVLADSLSLDIQAFESADYESGEHLFHGVMEWAGRVSRAMGGLQILLSLQEALFRQWLEWIEGRIQQRPRRPDVIFPAAFGFRSEVEQYVIEQYRATVFEYNEKVQDFRDYVAKLPEESSKLTRGQKKQIRNRIIDLSRLIGELRWLGRRIGEDVRYLLPWYYQQMQLLDQWLDWVKGRIQQRPQFPEEIPLAFALSPELEEIALLALQDMIEKREEWLKLEPRERYAVLIPFLAYTDGPFELLITPDISSPLDEGVLTLGVEFTGDEFIAVEGGLAEGKRIETLESVIIQVLSADNPWREFQHLVEEGLIKADGPVLGAWHNITDNLFDKLVDWSPSGDLLPELAGAWEMGPDEVTFHLQIWKRFHDGTDVDSFAVAYNFENDINLFLWHWRGSPVKLGLIQRIEVIDYERVRFYFNPDKISPKQLFQYLASPWGAIASPEAVERFGEDFGSRPVGSGPFKLREILIGKRVVLEPFEDYYFEDHYLKQLIFMMQPRESELYRLLQAGEAQVMVGSDPQLYERLMSSSEFIVCGIPTDYRAISIHIEGLPCPIFGTLHFEGVSNLEELTVALPYSW